MNTEPSPSVPGYHPPSVRRDPKTGRSVPVSPYIIQPKGITPPPIAPLNKKYAFTTPKGKPREAAEVLVKTQLYVIAAFTAAITLGAVAGWLFLT